MLGVSAGVPGLAVVVVMVVMVVVMVVMMAVPRHHSCWRWLCGSAAL